MKGYNIAVAGGLAAALLVGTAFLPTAAHATQLPMTEAYENPATLPLDDLGEAESRRAEQLAETGFNPVDMAAGGLLVTLGIGCSIIGRRSSMGGSAL